MKRTAIYRHFDPFGRLLYVGISLCAITRTSQHERDAPWFEMVARIDIEWFDTRHEAESAEWSAIKNERPIYNQTFNRRLKPEDRPTLVVGDTFTTPSTLKRIAGHT